MKRTVVKFFGLLASFVLVFAISNSVLAQGKSGNKGKSKGNENRGKSTEKRKSDKSGGGDKNRRDRSDRDDRDGKDRQNRDDDDNYRGNKDRWKSDKNRNNVGNKLEGKSNRFKGLSKKIGMSPEDAQDWYERERDLNPNLTFGQFVAANMIARRNNSRNPDITTEAILDRLRYGDNFGQAVKGLGLRGVRYDNERKRLRREIENDSYNDKNRDDSYNYRIVW